MAVTLKTPIQLPFSKPSISRNHVSPPSKLSFRSIRQHLRLTVITQSHKGQCFIGDINDNRFTPYKSRLLGAGVLDPRVLDEIPSHFVTSQQVSCPKMYLVSKIISMMKNPQNDCASVLNQLKESGAQISKWVLCQVVQDLIYEERHGEALQIYEWMSNSGRRYKLTPDETGTKLYVIAKVHGVGEAEAYLSELSDALKDKRLYTALLLSYVVKGMRTKAEFLFDKMRKRGYASDAVPFNTMMAFYKSSKLYDRVQLMASRMKDENISLDCRSYLIWISCCQSQESLEQVFKQVQKDTSLNASEIVLSTMADVYNFDLGKSEKALDCLKEIENRITNDDQNQYAYLIGLYYKIGDISGVKRSWEILKAAFPILPKWRYGFVIYCLVRLGDIEAAEKIYSNWDSLSVNYDDKIYKANFLLNLYVTERVGREKVDTLFNQMIEFGNKPNCRTWEILVEYHIREKRTFEAVSCLQNAFLDRCSADDRMLCQWVPNPTKVATILKICEEEVDMASKDALFELLREVGCLDDEKYMQCVYEFASIASIG